MAVSNEVLIKFRSDIGQLQSDINKIIELFQLVQQKAEQGLIQDPGGKTAKAGQELLNNWKQINAVITEAQRRLEAISSAGARFSPKGFQAVSVGKEAGEVAPGLIPGFQGLSKFSGFLNSDQIAAATNEARAALEAALAAAVNLQNAGEAYLSTKRGELGIQEQINALTAQGLFIQQQVARAADQSLGTNILTRRKAEIESVLANLTRLKAELRESALEQLPRRTADKIDTGIEQGESKLAAAFQRQVDLRSQELVLEQELANARRVGAADTEAIQRKLQAVQQERLNALEAEFTAQRRLGVPQGRLQAAEQVFGVAERIAQVNAEIQNLQNQLLQLFDPTAAAQLLEPVTKLQSELLNIGQQVNQENIGHAKKLELLQRQQQVIAAIDKEQERLTAIADPTQQIRQQTEGRPGGLLTQSLIAGFDDFARRFQTTLQFAISGAVIFGAQQLVREFFRAAVEVERTFADISSAFEFDIDAPRGSSEFNRAVEGIRREVLAAANEFNVLPTEANKAAFVMVSRFQDSTNAAKAFRAQMLATKISTIDQAEVLRALTAVAEAFSAQIVKTNEQMTLQERLMKREAASATLYGKALDVAVAIQQQFGVEVEDTLEGAARAAEGFSDLGFSLEETAALVASVSRQLGQTGQVASEKLVRSLGQITSPEIKQQLLDLAAATDEFTLTFSDLQTGRQAFSVISDEIRKLESAGSPSANKTIAQILQIIGQRREFEAVAAAFGTVDLQEKMIQAADDAAGSAERRFEFLKVTVSEILQSIAVRFQELAQNFERLGGLQAFKLFLQGVDALAAGINGLLKVVESLIGALESIPLIDKLFTSEAIRKVIGLALAFKALAVAAQAALLSNAFLTAGKAKVLGGAVAVGQGMLPGIGSGGKLVYGLGGKEAGEQLAATFKNLFSSSRRAEAGVKGLAGAFFNLIIAVQLATAAYVKQAGAAVLRFTGLDRLMFLFGKGKVLAAFSGLGVAAYALIGAFRVFRSETDRVATLMRDIATIQTEASNRARRDALSENLSPAEQRAREAEYAYQDLLAKSEEEMLGWWSTFIRQVLGILPGSVGAAIEDASNDQRVKSELELAASVSAFNWSDIQDVPIPGPSEKEVVAGSEEWWELLLASWRREFAIQGVAALAGDVDFSNEDQAKGYRALLDAASRGPRENLEDVITATNRFGLDILEAAIEAGKNAESGLQQSKLGIEEASRRFRFRSTKEGTAGLARSLIKASQERIANLEANIAEIQEISGGDPNDEQQKLLEDLAAQREAEIDSQLSLWADGTRDLLDTFAAAGASSVGLLQAELDLNKELIALARANEDRQALAGALRRQSELQAQIADAIRQNRAALRQAAIANSRTIADQIANTKLLIEDLKATIAVAVDRGDLDLLRDAYIALNSAKTSEINLVEDEAKRLREVTVLRAGPVGNRIVQANASIAGLLTQLKTLPVGSLEALEIEQQLRQVQAERAQSLEEQTLALIQAQIGPRDQLRSTAAKLESLKRALILTGQIFGETSQEFGDASLAAQQAQVEMDSLLLELADINRRLGSDLSDPYEQASLDLLAIAEKLAAPDLGEAERARLLAEKAQAELADQREFFNDRLFNLKYLVETDQLSQGGYLAALRRLQAQTDTTTRAGKEQWLEIQGLIDGLTGDMNDLAFNIPDQIRMPTLFEVRRSLAADQLGVNYMDNRVQDINVNVSNELELNDVLSAIDSAFGTDSRRNAPGAFRLTLGGV